MDEEACLIFGHPSAALVGEPIQKVRSAAAAQRWSPCCACLACSTRHRSPKALPPHLLFPIAPQQILPRVCPNGKTSELLLARGQRGGAKRSIGAVVAAEGAHADGRSLHVSVQAAESSENCSYECLEVNCDNANIR